MTYTNKEIRQILKGSIEWHRIVFKDSTDSDLFIKMLKDKSEDLGTILDMMEHSDILEGEEIIEDMCGYYEE